MFSQTAEYALLAVVTLADHYPNSQSVGRIATATNIPAGYLSKVLQKLARSSIVQANRGTRGGFILTKSPTEITALEVVNAVSNRRRRNTPASPDALGPEFDALGDLVKKAEDYTERVLRESSIASIVKQKAAETVLSR